MRRNDVDAVSPAPSSEFEDEMDSDLRGILKAELEPGERLLWAARSEPVAERNGLGFYLFGVTAFILMILGLIGIASFVMARRHHRFDDGSIGVGLLFIGVASIIVVGLMLNWNIRTSEFRRKASFLFAVTDRRAIAWSPEPKGDAVRIKTVQRGQIKSLERVQRRDGSGSLLFSTSSGQVSPDYEYDWHEFGFKDVHDVRRVEQIVRNNLLSVEKIA